MMTGLQDLQMVVTEIGRERELATRKPKEG